MVGLIAEGRLHLTWTYSRHRHSEATVESLAEAMLQALRTLIAHCQTPDAGGYTPSDFPEADLDQQDIDELIGILQNRTG